MEPLAPTAPDAARPPASVPGFLDHNRPLDPRWVNYRRITRWIAVGIQAGLWLVMTAILLLAGAPGAVVLSIVGGTGAVILLQAVLAQTWPAREWRSASYRVSDRGLEIRRGVWWRVGLNVPRSRIQHTNVTQGPLERSFGLGTLMLFTAGTDHSRVVLPGLAYDDASAIRDHLAAVDDDDAV